MISSIQSQPFSNETNSRVKRERTQNLGPRFNHLSDAVDEVTRSILVKVARDTKINLGVSHGESETRVFCFNALVKWSDQLNPELVYKKTLLSGHTSDSLKESVQKASLQLIKKSGQQAVELGASFTEKISWITFELIRIPLKKGHELSHFEWHRDPGYIKDFTEESCYSDYTTIFMLTNPEEWKGGYLDLQKNGTEKGDLPPDDYKGTTKRIKYEFRGALTWDNTNSRHKVTKITPTNRSQDRIIFVCSFFGDRDTELFRKYHGKDQ